MIVGEVRGSEAADMLHALHTGHPGSLCTGHANSCVEMLNRLSTMVLAGSSLPFEAVVRQIVMGIDILVHIVRSAGGRRLVGEIVTLDHASEDAFRVVPQFVYKEDSGLEKV
ncbi:MAG: ATPase, T2SS/T4P/T4SS family [Oscillospiraceae bacterium]|nr:ATPase, T2SS/T4P/T4SS family [Oscillospiraceae bacterium]